MRLSADPSDRGRKPELVPHYDVYLDGRKLSGCLTADEEEGLVVRYVVDGLGRAARDGDEWATEELRGVVELRHRES